MKRNKIIDWILRFVKGMFVGTGFILPGVSGGALAAIFGLYEKLIGFIAHITRDFKKNILFFIPVGLGMLAGIVALSYPLEYFLDKHMGPTVWFFVGAILGTLPKLWAEAGKKGRQPKHILIGAVSLLLSSAALYAISGVGGGSMPLNFGTWILAGIINALGVLVPGLSPSNFLLFFGMYTPMVEAFKTLDMGALIPLALGMLACLFAFSKLVDMLFKRAYAVLFHVIIGVVVSSTAMILITLPMEINYLSLDVLPCVLTCAAGAVLGWWMCGLEKKYKPVKD